uniref:Uncharacterized protein n=1 Tax=Setaria italica TaxID=4555 RepID=K3Y3F9_SETIT
MGQKILPFKFTIRCEFDILSIIICFQLMKTDTTGKHQRGLLVSIVYFILKSQPSSYLRPTQMSNPNTTKIMQGFPNFLHQS